VSPLVKILDTSNITGDGGVGAGKEMVKRRGRRFTCLAEASL